jgi:hypothetical protein
MKASTPDVPGVVPMIARFAGVDKMASRCEGFGEQAD